MVVRWWASVHGLASLVITRRITGDHRYLPVGDVDAFVAEYIAGTIDGLAPDVIPVADADTPA